MGIATTLILLFFAGSGLILFGAIDDLRQQSNTILNVNLKVVSQANNLEKDVQSVWQWLTDISATRGQDGLNDGFDNAEKSAQAFVKHAGELKDSFSSLSNQEGLKALASVETNFADFYKAGKTMANAYVNGGPPMGNRHMADFDAVAERMISTLSAFIEAQQKALHTNMNASIERSEKLTSYLTYVTIPLSLLIIVFGMILSRSITRHIRIPISKAVGGLTSATAQLSSAVSQVAISSQSLAASSSQQAASLEEASSTLEVVAAGASDATNNTTEAHTVVLEVKRLIEEGKKAMSGLANAISEIKEASDKTAKINKDIDALAFQTNLLALNAAVEAARAGEAGKGFAVVAEEVRTLAQRSAEASRNTTEIIISSQNKAEIGVKATQIMEENLVNIDSAIFDVVDLMTGVTESSQTQKSSIEQINQAIGQMESLTQNNAATAQETSSAAQELTSHAELIESIAFDLSDLIEEAKRKPETKQLGQS